MFKTRRFLAAILVLWLFAVGCGAQTPAIPQDPINWGTPEQESFKDGGIKPAPWGFIQSCVDPKSEVADEDCERGGFKK